MTFIEKVKSEIRTKNITPIFTNSDIKSAGISDPNHNMSNYDKKNQGSLNKKVLVSRKITGEMYYTFDEQIFE